MAMLEQSQKHYFLCDSSKHGQEYPYVIADVSLVDKQFSE
jgi:DeoR/GlpR family transcriptional regulator of sugar metabolism